MKSCDLLKTTEKYMSNKVRLPVVRDEFFWPTEASVELDEIHPGESNVIGNCLRAAYYRYEGKFKGQAFTSYTQWIFLGGKAVEAALIETWKCMGLFIDNNVKFRSKEKHISGEMDVIIIDPITEKSIVVELKTYYGYDATKNLKGNPKKNIIGKPKDAHLLQLLIYLDLHKHIFEYGKLIYIDRTCKDNVEFTISLQKEGENTYPVINGTVSRRFSVEQIYERYEKLEVYIEQNIVPPRDFELEFSSEKIEREFAAGNISKSRYEAWQKKNQPIGDWNCSYCRYKTECYGLNQGPDLPEEETDSAY